MTDDRRTRARRCSRSRTPRCAPRAGDAVAAGSTPQLARPRRDAARQRDRARALSRRARRAAPAPLAGRPARRRGGLMLVVIVTDNGFAAEAIRRSFRGASGVRVAGYVDGRRPCGAAVAEAQPGRRDRRRDDVVGHRRRPHLRGPPRGPDAKIIVLTAEPDADWLGDAVRAGRRRRDRQDGAADHARPARPRDLGRHRPSRLRRPSAGRAHERDPRQPHAARARDPPARRARRVERPDRRASSG